MRSISRCPTLLTVATASTLLLLLLLTGCTDSRTVLSEAYVAPISVHLRSELSSKSNTVADLKHGDHVQVVDVQRRMVKVRTDKGVEGWLDSAQLLSSEQMTQLKQRRSKEAALPSEGAATAYEMLNIHIDPDRQSPAFAQIAEGGSVAILGHKIQPKISTSSRASGLVISRPPTLSRKQRKEQQTRTASLRLPSRPIPPKPPANWQELSAERIDGEPNPTPPPAKKALPIAPPPKPERPAKPVVMEDWTLVKTAKNEVGWVLTRNLLMSIPDEVAQYAEGKHITSFFDLGTVSDDVKGPKHNWLWTTSAPGVTYDFDSWRVFLWNKRRHRYETSFRQRDLEGYFPVHVEPPDPESPLIRTFQLITKDDDGKMRRRTYTFDAHLVHLAKTEDYNPAGGSSNPPALTLDPQQLASKASKSNWLKRQWAEIRHRVTGK